MAINRRTFLSVFGSFPSIFVAGCLNGESGEDESECFREKWPVVLYNESAKTKSIEVTITDDENQIVFSDTIKVAPDTDTSTGVELDLEVSYDQSYTFEAGLPRRADAIKETVVNCGNVYIFVTGSGEVIIRDDDLKGDM
ncbi:hypothetical protein [Natrinema sp. DC36]|uniref:hypothetical protein n=1 Tax=Natrinema sp. DC36 TaxID=2878680 RepID=UPI001CF07EEA|nr:hypothetical protein [Natrinema sp. DC36]